MPPPSFDWVNDFPAAVSICDTKGTIIALNRLARDNFSKQGGEAPWYSGGQFAGLTETIIILPDQVPTKQRC